MNRDELAGADGRAMADRAIDAGVMSGLNYAVGFLAGCASAFLAHGKRDMAQAFTAAAAELGRVQPIHVRLQEGENDE